MCWNISFESDLVTERNRQSQRSGPTTPMSTWYVFEASLEYYSSDTRNLANEEPFAAYPT